MKKSVWLLYPTVALCLFLFFLDLDGIMDSVTTTCNFVPEAFLYMHACIAADLLQRSRQT